jgi:Anti-sigma-K factor rskA
VWRRYQGRLAAVAAAAAALIIAALVVIPNLGGGSVAVSLYATTAAKLMGDGAATGRATAHQAGPSWTFTMTVHGLKVLPGNDVYECWWVGPGSTKSRPQLVSGGTFVVDNSGSATVTMTTGVDPRLFRTMEVTAESPGTGAVQGKVLLTGRTL